MRRIGLVTVALLAIAGGAAAKEHFVSPAGDDSNDGSSVGKAFATIDKAAKAAAAGDVVNILPGTYVGRIRPAASGTPEAPITYRRQGDGEAVITTSKETDGGAWHERFAFKLGAGNNWTVLEDLTFREAEAWIYIGDGAHHNTVRGCTFDGVRIFHGIFVNSGSWNRIEKCRFLKAIPYPEGWDGSQELPPLADYITIWRDSHHNLIEACEFHEITHVACGIGGHDPEFRPRCNMIRNNTFHNPRWKPIGFHHAENVLVEGNRMYGQAASFMQYQARNVIVRRNILHGYRTTSGQMPGDYHGALWLRSTVNEYGGVDDARLGRIYHNTFYDCAKPMAYGPRQWSLPVCENVLKNNVFWKFDVPLVIPKPFYANFTTQNANYFVRNVIASGTPGAKIIDLATVEGHELVTLAEMAEKDRELCRRDTFIDNIEADPKLAIDARERAILDPARMSAADFMPSEGSPCVDAGAPLTAASADGSGRVLPVDDPHYFCDGWGMIDGDMVVVGKAGTARVVKVDLLARTLTLDRDLAWKTGDSVNLPYAGAGPDIGAVELVRP